MKKNLLLLCIGVLFILISSIFVDNSDILLYRITGAIICISFVLISLGIMGYYLLKSEPKIKNVNMADRYKEVSLNEIKKYELDIDELKKILYNKFIDIHSALSEVDTKKLKMHLTDDLYKAYLTELNDLKKENKKIINKEIELIDIKIYNIVKIYGALHIDVYLNVRMIDYVSDCFDSLNNTNKLDFEYELNFVKKMDAKNDDSDYLLSKKYCINIMKIKNVDDK